ncbi:phosphate regulon sensor histidine kinase PhoR [Silanimonas lenta]|uniref:phosphate regulon sensor histidine kinase PhoR n=1 Tax=Silanimonas lenta TaxID=265429 RepID=UPI0003FD5BE4|nr:phosphate regulon sensor histidine kinase PhoR [Silanimonas lenta]
MTVGSLLRRAWRQSVARLLLILCGAAALGLLLGAFWPLLALAAFAILAWHYWRLHRLLSQLYQRRRLRDIDGRGLWDDLEMLLHRRQNEGRARVKRLLGLVRGYRRAAALMPDAVLLVDRESGRIDWCNRQARALLGLDAHAPGAVGTAFPGNAVQGWFAAGQSDEPLIDQPSPIDPNVRLSLRLLPYSPEQWLLVVRDVTKLLRLEQLRRDFVANVSHELRTPLTVVHGYLDILDTEDYPELEPMLTEMRKQSARMSQLVEDLLTLSRLEAQEALAQREVVAMAPLLATLRREAEALSAGRHRIRVLDEARVDLLGSTRELHSAFSNLVSNAVRYTPVDGSIEVRFERSPDGGAVLSVQDSGYGIPAQHLPRLTERFYRVSTSRARETGGTGLGLSIVKHVLNLHQARLEITSEVGKGSRFACVFGPEAVAEGLPEAGGEA